MHRINRELELVQRVAQRLQHIVATGPARLQLPDRRADVRAHAIVHVAQDPVTLAADDLSTCDVLQALVADRQGLLFLLHQVVEVAHEMLRLTTHRTEATEHNQTGRQTKKDGRVVQAGSAIHAGAHPKLVQVYQAHEHIDQNREGQQPAVEPCAAPQGMPHHSQGKQQKGQPEQAVPDRQRRRPPVDPSRHRSPKAEQAKQQQPAAHARKAAGLAPTHHLNTKQHGEAAPPPQ